MVETLIKPLTAGLIGSGIQASLTPALHMLEGRAQGFDYSYELIDLEQRQLSVDHLPDLLNEAEKRGLRGLNITHPCKQLVIPHLDELASDARSIGAVNTVVFRNGSRYGHNTDWWGFAESFRRGLPEADLTSAVQIGAGGAGVATAYALLSLGLKQLTVFDKDAVRTGQLVQTMSELFPAARIIAGNKLGSSLKQASGLVHATPTGMINHPGLPLHSAVLEPRHWVAEIVYFPLETALVKLAREKGCPTLDGGGMAIFQAVGAFELFTGRKPDIARMRRHFEHLTSS